MSEPERESIFFRPIKPRSVAGTMFIHVRKKLLAGLVTLTPIAITVFVSVWIFRAVAGSEWLIHAAQATRIADKNLATAVAFLATVAIIYFIGLISTSFTVRQLIGLAERMLVQIPVVKLFYVTSKQLIDALNQPAGGSSRKKVVFVEYPRTGVFTIGFATGESIENGTTFVHVFIPTTPNPTSGWLLLFNAEDVQEINYSTEEAMRLILSGGIVGKPEVETKPYAAKAATEPADGKKIPVTAK